MNGSVGSGMSVRRIYICTVADTCSECNNPAGRAADVSYDVVRPDATGSYPLLHWPSVGLVFYPHGEE